MGIVIAAPSTGSGKTVITSGLLRALTRRGLTPRACKVGPDYIDGHFLEIASGRECYNLDSFAMRAQSLEWAVRDMEKESRALLCEGVMGLFDSSFEGGGSTAELAQKLDWPVLLVVSAKGQGESLAALVKGFLTYRKNVNIVGLIINNISSSRQQDYLRAIFRREFPDLPVLGFIPFDPKLTLGSRHLGLLQAEELENITRFIDDAANIVEEYCDVDKISELALSGDNFKSSKKGKAEKALLSLSHSHIAIARDRAFSFHYPVQMNIWREAGIKISFFSPLKDEAPETEADMVFLPGGYPELYLPRLESANKFLGALRKMAERKTVYGECGGYMVLGRTVTGENGHEYEMAGLLPLETSFAHKKRSLGYRRVKSLVDHPFGKKEQGFYGHEFHYTTIIREEGQALWHEEITGQNTGLVSGNVSGSFVHLIDSI